MHARLLFQLRADIPDGKRRDSLPQWGGRREHPVIPMPVPPRRCDQRCQTVKQLRRYELDNTADPGQRGLTSASGPNPVPAVALGQAVANPLRSVACARHDRKPI